jgi:hypothetical protein
MKISANPKRSEVLEVLVHKTEKWRKQVARSLKGKKEEKDFHPTDLETSEIDKNSHLPYTVLCQIVSLLNMRRIRDGKKFSYRQGVTTLKHLLQFYFPPHSSKKSRKKRAGSM